MYFTYIFSVVARIKSISCNTEMVDDSLHIICISSNIYHETQCDISIRYPGKKKNMVSTPSINNNRERSSSDQTVFKTVCSVFISKEDLFPGQYEAVVTMYPNITGTSDDKQFSTIHALSVNLEYPSITVKNCPEIIEENTEVTCTCERTDKSLIKFSLVWFDSSGKKTASSGSPYLKFIATRTINKGNPYFICQTESWFRWKNSNITIAYEPIIIVTVKNHTCKHQNLPHEVTVTCETELIYPAAKCHYTIYYNHLEYIHKSSQAMYYHNDIYQNTIHYKSTCVVNISKENLEPGQYNIKIYMYPNVTGNTSDTQFGSFTIISINIGSQSPFYLANRISLLTSLIAGCLGIFLTFIVICIHKYLKQRAAPRNLLDICVACTESKNISSNYDEINEGYILATHIDYQGHVRFDDNDEYRRIGDNIQKATQEIEMLEENDFYELIDDEIVAHKVNVEIIPTDQSFVCLNIVNIVNVESTHAVLNENDLNI